MIMKYIFVLGIILYLIYKVGSFFFRAGAAAQQLRNFQDQQRKSDPTKSASKAKKGHVNGGDYIDFEEVKK
jgi:hypothetical protein